MLIHHNSRWYIILKNLKYIFGESSRVLQEISAYNQPSSPVTYSWQVRGDGWKSRSTVYTTQYLRGFVMVTGTTLSASKSGLMFKMGTLSRKSGSLNGLESATKSAGSILNFENLSDRDLPEGIELDFLVPGITISASFPALLVNLM